METIFLSGRSVEHHKAEVSKGCVRGDVLHSSFAVTHHPAIKDRCLLSQVVCSNPGGVVASLPGFVIRSTSQSFLAQLLESVAMEAKKRGTEKPDVSEGYKNGPYSPREA